jgi:hypothetical protein
MEAAVVAAPDTQFLMLHAGWPFDKEAIASLSHPNVFLDISGSSVHLYARNLAGIVRHALEWFPEKTLYGTDAYIDTAHAFLSSTEPRSNFLQGCEETRGCWIAPRDKPSRWRSPTCCTTESSAPIRSTGWPR